MKRHRLFAAATLLLSACSSTPASRELLGASSIVPSRVSFAEFESIVASDFASASGSARAMMAAVFTDEASANRLHRRFTDLKVSIDQGEVALAERFSASDVPAEAAGAPGPAAVDSSSQIGDAANVPVIRLTLANVASALGE